MIGVSVLLDDTKNFIDMVLDPSMFERELDSKSLWKELNEGQYKTFYISQNTLKSACDKANHYFKTNDNTKVRDRIGERRPRGVRRQPGDSGRGGPADHRGDGSAGQ